MFANAGPTRCGLLFVDSLRRRLQLVQLCVASALLLTGVWICVLQVPVVAAYIPGLPPRDASEATSLSCLKSNAPAPSASNADAAPGLHITTEPVRTYAVQGATTAQIRGQLAHCSPITSFAAATSYDISTRYSYFVSNGRCAVSSATVDLHLSQTMPRWRGHASAAVKHEWQRYLASLTAHENGHKLLDARYAQQILADMQHISAPSCTKVTHRVNSLVDARLQQLNAANEAYDAQTNHGATQGAVLH